MAHEIDFSKGYAAFTRRKDSTPAWHGLGGETPVDAPLETWTKNGGLDFKILESEALFHDDQGMTRTAKGNKVLYRDDTKEPLSVVSSRYKVVQPLQVLDFFQSLISERGYTMETCGSLKGGARIWALAKANNEIKVGDIDVIRQYLLLVTSCDKQMSTQARDTSICVVCNNTLELAVNGAGNRVIVPHSTKFDADAVKRDMGLSEDNWSAFSANVSMLATKKISDESAKTAIVSILGDASLPPEDQPNQRAMAQVFKLFKGDGLGADLPGRKQTAWGLVNAVTEHVDYHAQARNGSTRLNSAWFGNGADIKRRALTIAHHLAFQQAA